jgi:hypothetical protein
LPGGFLVGVCAFVPCRGAEVERKD